MGSGCTLTFKKIHTNSSDIRCGHTEANYSGYICVIMRGQKVTADQTREHFRHLLWWSLVLVRGEAPVLHYWSKMDLQRPNTSVDQRSLHWSDRSTWSFRHPGYCFYLIVPPSPSTDLSSAWGSWVTASLCLSPWDVEGKWLFFCKARDMEEAHIISPHVLQSRIFSRATDI